VIRPDAETGAVGSVERERERDGTAVLDRCLGSLDTYPTCTFLLICRLAVVESALWFLRWAGSWIMSAVDQPLSVVGFRRSSLLFGPLRVPEPFASDDRDCVGRLIGFLADLDARRNPLVYAISRYGIYISLVSALTLEKVPR
jgi:hypothetical protein